MQLSCRLCQTDHAKLARCQQILAACVNVIPAGIVQQEAGLSVALDAIRETLQEFCASAIDADGRATQTKLLEPVIAQLMSIIMLNNKTDSSYNSLSGQASMSTADIQRIGSEAALLALEMRCILAKQSTPSNKEVPLVGRDINVLTGGWPWLFAWLQCQQLVETLILAVWYRGSSQCNIEYAGQ